MYYNQLIKRGRLVKYWMFWGGSLSMSFKFNYNFFSIIYKINFFNNINKLIFSIKNLLPLCLNISYLKGKILFVASKCLYSKILRNNIFLSLTKELIYWKPGVFSNFSCLSENFFNKLDFKKNPAILIFFSYRDNDYLVMEAKKKKY